MARMNAPNSDGWVCVASYEHLSGCLRPRAAARA
jgi:hypothetical protein